jgi:hypothetical protein
LPIRNRRGFSHEKLIFIAGATYFVTRRWDKLSQRDRTKIKNQAKKLGYKAAQFVGRELEELDYRLAWKKLGR